MAPARKNTPTSGIRIEVSGLCKQFGPVVANQDVTFDLRPGEILGLVGENGAGKSTCINMLFGHHRPDAGSIRVDGESVEFKSPRDAIARGIGLVHQHFQLAPALTVYDHLRLVGGEEVRERAVEAMNALELQLDLEARVEDLPIGKQQQLEILKVMCQGARAVILDEPTAVLTPLEVKPFLARLRKMRASGHSVILISHKLDEVLDVCDRIAVIRSGTIVGVVESRAVTADDVAAMMMGETRAGANRADGRASVVSSPDTAARVVQALHLHNYKCRHERISIDVDLVVKAGEIVGVAGVDGNGQQQLVESILRLQPRTSPESGAVVIGDLDVTALPPHELREKVRVALLPFDRYGHGMIEDVDLATNLLLSAHCRRQMRAPGLVPWVRWKEVRKKAVALISEYGVVCDGWDALIGGLSGGNQQKFVVARELMDGPALILAAHPTRGVDVRSSRMIRHTLKAAALRGAGVLLVSSEMHELLDLSDRIVVMLRGRVAGEFTRDAGRSYDVTGIGQLMTGAQHQGEEVRGG